MDFHVEQLINKRKTPLDYLLATIIIFVTVLLWLLTFLFLRQLMTIAALLILLIGWGALKLLQGLSVEYEYELTNHYLDIDKIMGKARRKEIISIDFRNIEQCTYVSAPEFNNTQGITKTYELSGNPNAENRVFVDYAPEGGERIRVIFRPNDKIKDCLKKAAPKTVKL